MPAKKQVPITPGITAASLTRRRARTSLSADHKPPSGMNWQAKSNGSKTVNFWKPTGNSQPSCLHLTPWIASNKTSFASKSWCCFCLSPMRRCISATGESSIRTCGTRCPCHSVMRDRSMRRACQYRPAACLPPSISRAGIQAATREGTDIVVKFDADLQHASQYILSLIQPVLNDQAEVVYG